MSTSLNKVIIIILVTIIIGQYAIIIDQNKVLHKQDCALKNYHNQVAVRMEQLDLLEWKIRSIVDIWE